MSLKNALETAKEILEMESMTMGVEAEMDKKSVKKKKAGGTDTEVAADADGKGEKTADGVTPKVAEPTGKSVPKPDMKPSAAKSEVVDDLDKMDKSEEEMYGSEEEMYGSEEEMYGSEEEMHGSEEEYMSKPEEEMHDEEEESAEFKKQMKKLKMKEHLGTLFSGEELSEEFKDKASTVFEAAVDMRVEEIRSELSEEFESTLEEEKEALATKLDEYLTYVVENWMEENKLAVETGMRLQIAESFIDDLKGLFENHFIQVPDSKVNLLDDLFEKNEETKKSELLGALESYRKNEIAHQISEGLTELDKEKFFNLSEEVSFEDEKTYSEKLGGIKESYFKKTKSAPVLTEETETHEPEKVIVEGSDAMSGYLRALERNNR